MPDAGNMTREYRHDTGDTLSFEFLRSKRKTLAIYINRNASVTVRAPLRMALADVYLFLHERWPWIQTQRTRFLQNPAPEPFRYRDGESFRHMGQDCRLRIEPGLRDRALFSAGTLTVGLKKESAGDEKALVAIIERWQRREAVQVFAERLAHCRERMRDQHLPATELRIRKMRSRWGSCSRSAVITLNLELIKMPVDCIDYVIVHELCHLREFNHSPKFYALQEHYVPDWQERKRELNQLARENYGM
jgi:predicted metal-dependent hydrolase